MSDIEDVFHKVQNNSLRFSDVPVMLKRLDQDARAGRIELTPEDMEWFEVYEFLLRQLDLRTGNAPGDTHTGDWRGSVKDFAKLKTIIDEMEEKRVITEVNWNVGGLALFTIPNNGFYRRHVCCLISAHLGRLYANQ